MQIAPMTTEPQPAVLAYLRAAPYRNALPLSNSTQLRNCCDVLVAEAHGEVLGMVSTYHDLPFLNLTFAADRADVVEALLKALTARNPHLLRQPIYALLPVDRRDRLADFVRIIEEQVEHQMTIASAALPDTSSYPLRRLAAPDIPQMDALAQVVGSMSWHSNALAFGPAYGCFVDGRLAAMAATHYATPDVVEIGYVATHPDMRRRGYAAACTAAVARAAFALSRHVFLMVLEDNAPALAAYRQLGFQTIAQYRLIQFML